MLEYKIDIIAKLKEKGYNQTKIRRENLLTQSAMTAIRNGKPIHWTTIDKICCLLNCQPSDFIEYKANPLE